MNPWLEGLPILPLQIQPHAFQYLDLCSRDSVQSVATLLGL